MNNRGSARETDLQIIFRVEFAQESKESSGFCQHGKVPSGPITVSFRSQFPLNAHVGRRYP